MQSVATPRPLVQGAVTCPKPVPGAALRLFLFHHAGGSHALYQGWEREFPADWELCLLDAPGRGRLYGQPLLDTADGLVGFFHGELLPWLDRPFAFFGHSMGALIGYELTRHLLDQGDPLPVWLGLSGCGAPSAGPGDGGRARHRFSDAELRAWLRGVGATPDEVLDNDSLWRVFGPTFRSDFALVDTWRPEPAAPPLPVPLSVFGGTQDAIAGKERLAAWAPYSTDFQGVRMHQGGHFYLLDHHRLMARQITSAVFSAQRAAARRTA